MHPLLIENAIRNKQIVDSLLAIPVTAPEVSNNPINRVSLPKPRKSNFLQGMLLLGVVILTVKGVQYYFQKKQSKENRNSY